VGQTDGDDEGFLVVVGQVEGTLLGESDGLIVGAFVGCKVVVGFSVGD